jgi:hypothetical protein
MMRSSSMGFAIALVSLLAACGGDDKDTGKKDNSSSKAGSGSSDTGAVPCGDTTCKLPSGVTGTLCCKDNFAGTCGLMSGGSCRELPKTDDRCPAPQVMVRVPMMAGGGTTAFGCCTSSNQCGIDFGIGGCQPRTTLCMVVGADQIDKIQPKTCDGDDLPLPETCGMNMINIPSFAGQSGGM